MSFRILVIEDDDDIRKNICLLLEENDYITDAAATGMDGLLLFSAETSLIILDIMLPDISGADICKKVRKTSTVPILIVSALNKNEDVAAGLDYGADDYLTKPFSEVVLLAKTRALIRRHQEYDVTASSSGKEKKWYERNGIRVHKHDNIVTKDGQEIHLTTTEYRLLRFLIAHPGEIYSHDVLYEAVWRTPYRSADRKLLSVHMKNLRQKIEDKTGTSQLILTLWGEGNKFA